MVYETCIILKLYKLLYIIVGTCISWRPYKVLYIRIRSCIILKAIQMNALKCRTLASSMLLWTHTPQHKHIFSLSPIMNWTMCGRCSSSALNRMSTWTCEFMDKTPQTPEEHLVMMIDKAQKTNLHCISKASGSVSSDWLSVKAKKFQDGDQFNRL